MQQRLVFAIALCLLTSAPALPGACDEQSAQKPAGPRYVVQTDKEIAVPEPGPHDGGGKSTAFKFFETVNGMNFTFRKRALHPGAAIGYHPQKEDEIYYVLSGTGTMTVNGGSFEVTAGTAVLTRPGSSHGLAQKGSEDLVLIIAYENRR